MIQFPSVEFIRKRYSNITNAEQVEKIFEHNEGKTIVLMTVVVDEVINKIKSYQNDEFEVIDLLLSPITHIENFLGQKG